MQQIPRPGPGEFAPFYAGYIEALAGADLREELRGQPARLRSACAGLSDERALHRYAPGKWSIKEVVGHLIDAERIFSYRAFRVSRGDPTPLAGFEENAFVAAGRYDRRPLQELLSEFEIARASTLALLTSVDADAWERQGTANGTAVSTRALAHITAGHARHHLRILEERYGLGASG